MKTFYPHIILILFTLLSCNFATEYRHKLELSIDRKNQPNTIYRLHVENEVLDTSNVDFTSFINLKDSIFNFITIHGATTFDSSKEIEYDPEHSSTRFHKFFDNIIGSYIDSPLHSNIGRSREETYEFDSLISMQSSSKGLKVYHHYYGLNNGTKFNFYEIEWSGITQSIKDSLILYDEDAYRTDLSSNLKEKIVIDYLGDLAFYIDEAYFAKIHSEINSAFDSIWNHMNPNHRRNITLIGSAFGSKILTDHFILNYHQYTFLAKVMMLCDEYGDKMIGDVFQLIEGQDELNQKETLNAFKSKKSSEILESILNERDSRHEKISIDSLSCLQVMQKIKENDIQNYFSKLLVTDSELLNQVNGICFLSNQNAFFNLLDIDDEFPDSFASFVEFVTHDFSEVATKYLGDQSLQVISFIDPHDVLSYPIPDNDTVDNIHYTNIELNNNHIWSVNSDRMRQYVLPQIKSPMVKNQLYSNLDQERIEFSLNIVKPNQTAKENKALVNILLSGNGGSPDINILSPKPYLHRKNEKRIKKGKKQVGSGIVRKGFTFLGLLNKIQGLQVQDAPQLPSKTLYFPEQQIGSSIDGIKEVFLREEKAEIFTIHGMKSKDPDHFDDLINLIVDELDLTLDGISSEDLGSEKRNDKLLETTQLISKTYKDNEGRRLIFHVYYWSPYSRKAKAFIGKFNEAKFSNQSAASQLVRHHLIDDGLTDVVLTLKKNNDLIHTYLDTAFTHIQKTYMKENPDEKVSKNLFIISSSLGSNYMYDYFQKNGGRKQGVDTICHYMLEKRIHTYFMLSNQLPLIRLTKLGQNDENKKNEDSNSTVSADEFFNLSKNVTKSKTIENKKRENISKDIFDWGINYPHLNIVAFNDPNDILSFKLQDPETENLKVTTIQLQVAPRIRVSTAGGTRLAEYIDRKMDYSIVEFLQNNPDKDLNIKENFQKSLNLFLPKGDKQSESNYIDFSIRFDQAHFGVTTHPEILDIMINGRSF